jgi:hypothetical protein
MILPLLLLLPLELLEAHPQERVSQVQLPFRQQQREEQRLPKQVLQIPRWTQLLPVPIPQVQALPLLRGEREVPRLLRRVLLRMPRVHQREQVQNNSYQISHPIHHLRQPTLKLYWLVQVSHRELLPLQPELRLELRVHHQLALELMPKLNNWTRRHLMLPLVPLPMQV